MRNILIVLLMVAPMIVHAEWVSYRAVISGGWGDDDGQFGIDHEDTYDNLPGMFDVSDTGRIVLADNVNSRFKIYNADGSLVALVVPPLERPELWDLMPVFVGENISLILNKFYFYGPNGDLINQTESPKKAGEDQDIRGVLYLYQSNPINKWLEYSSTGELLNTFSKKPLVLGQVSSDVLNYNAENAYRKMVSFDDIQVSIATTYKPEYMCHHFNRDADGHIYCVNNEYPPFTVTRYNQCGKPVSQLILPKDDVTVLQDDLEESSIINSQYMDPKIDNRGNAYATRRTPDDYSLVKWKWRDTANDKNDGPDAPINLKATQVTARTVKVTWEGSLQDPGCVTSYQLLRSEIEGTTGMVVADIVKGIRISEDDTAERGKTYYYQIKALSAVNDSAPSNTIIVTIPSK